MNSLPILSHPKLPGLMNLVFAVLFIVIAFMMWS
jgi:hypothetical protein